MQSVIIYTDGAALGNPGKGGYGAVLMYGLHRAEISCGFIHTTNNRMELLAVIMSLYKLKNKCNVTIFTDSKYVCDAVEKGWLNGWIKKGWVKVKNVDLWKRLIPMLAYHQVSFKWVKGHAGIEENERCDFLATEAAKNRATEEDSGYMASLNISNLFKN